MAASIDIDIGGTFTDCFVRYKGEERWCKVRTTPFNLAKGMIQVIEEAAVRFGMELEELLGHTDIIRYSTTMAMNKLIEHKGPKLGLITTEGFEDTLLIGRASQWSDGLTFKQQRNIARVNKPKPLIPKELTVGVKERIDGKGNVLRPLDEAHFRKQLDKLVDQGVRGFVVCLLWSFLNPVHEQRIKELIEQEYNESYLGSMPVFLSSEVSPRKFEYTRTTMTVLNAYLHQSMYEELVGIGQELRGRGYKKPLMMVHNTGGMAGVFRTAAVQTYNGGPVAGLMGSSTLGQWYGYKNVVVTDMGGTSFDIGMVVEGSTRFYQFAPTIDRWTIDATVLDTHSIGAGGGSIARVNPFLNNRLEVGPESAGSLPGPAAYKQGGREPTVTDADLVLGYINPDNFHGGKLQLSTRHAERAIQERIAKPLNISVEEAAFLIKRIVDAQMGGEIYKETVLKGYDPRDFIVFALGGGGPTHGCGYTKAAHMKRVVVFPFSSTFCAYGSSTMDILHIHEKSRHFNLLSAKNKQWMTDHDSFNQVVDSLIELAVRDFIGEGFDPSKILFELELDMKFGGQLNVKRTASPHLKLSGESDVKELYAAFEKEFSEAYSALGLNPEAGVEIEAFILKARVPQPTHPPVKKQLEESNSATAQVGTRMALWDPKAGKVETPIYDMTRLYPGISFEGPAIVEAEDMTLVVEPDWRLTVDEFGAVVLTLEREENAYDA